jgi:hypothetical protein
MGERVPRKPVTTVPTVMATMVDVFMFAIWLDMMQEKIRGIGESG